MGLTEASGKRACGLGATGCPYALNLAIPPSGIMRTITALQTPSLALEPSWKMCLELGPRMTSGSTSSHRASVALSLISLSWVDAPGFDGDAVSRRRAKTWDAGHSLPEKWDVSMSRWVRLVRGAARRMITLGSVSRVLQLWNA